ncbi:unnamed protein product [Dibothriocephalus latus]|uniref:Uncharacterized protein n=1 Tax=Dibothriocephalus latus TaxID=60516 RepID=A0A3P6R5X6_DIBLA|nr:unnamed protein product [Dibothriocephalus latus]
MAYKGGRSYLKDLRSLYVNIEESTNEQASISSVCGDKLEILLTPNEGPYTHAMFTLEVGFESLFLRFIQLAQHNLNLSG